jgi:uncharacterized protein YkwD
MKRRISAGLVCAALGWPAACFAINGGAVSARPPASLDPAALAYQDSYVPGIRYAAHLVELVNRYRSHHGLPRLEWAPELGAIASEHSLAMAARRRISHDGFEQRFQHADSSMCVENVGAAFPHAEAQLDGWRGSPAHLRNLLEPGVGRVGVANASAFVTFFACR